MKYNCNNIVGMACWVKLDLVTQGLSTGHSREQWLGVATCRKLTP